MYNSDDSLTQLYSAIFLNSQQSFAIPFYR